jgi:hypothetical protein
LSAEVARAPHPDSGFSPVERCGSFEGSAANQTSGQPERAFRGLGDLSQSANDGEMTVVSIRFGWLVALAAVGLSWALVARTLANPPPPAKSPVEATAVVWGGLVFTDRRPLQHWLHVRGVAYSVWSGRHLDAARMLRAAP